MLSLGPMFRKFYRHNDKMYLVLREIPESKVNDKEGKPNMELLKTWRDWVGSDHVLRTSYHYLLCETIKDLKFKEL